MKRVCACIALATIGLAIVASTRTSAADGDTAISRVAFGDVARVLTSPRCQNCHTATGFPRQGDDRHRHLMHVTRGPDGHGIPALPCSACHGRANNPASGVPGADEDWHLAPLSMAWDGLSAAGLCRQLKDPRKNGGRTGEAILNHLHTNLVAWAWHPGTNARGAERTAPPMAYPVFLRAAETWVKFGAVCPDEASPDHK